MYVGEAGSWTAYLMSAAAVSIPASVATRWTLASLQIWSLKSYTLHTKVNAVHMEILIRKSLQIEPLEKNKTHSHSTFWLILLQRFNEHMTLLIPSYSDLSFVQRNRNTTLERNSEIDSCQ